MSHQVITSCYINLLMYSECLLLDWLVVSKQDDIETVYRLVEGNV